MLLYNVTVNVDHEIENEWFEWMKDIHIPEIMETGCFVENHIYKLLQVDPEESGSTFSIQYFAKSILQVNDYLENFAPKLREDHNNRYKNRFVAFRTVLEQVT